MPNLANDRKPTQYATSPFNTAVPYSNFITCEGFGVYKARFPQALLKIFRQPDRQLWGTGWRVVGSRDAEGKQVVKVE